MYEKEISALKKAVESRKNKAVLDARKEILSAYALTVDLKNLVRQIALELGYALNGKDGKDGLNGKDGRNGIDGKPGTDGKPGLNGKDGRDGKPGLNGIDGRNGLDGKDGADGKDGVGIEAIKKIDGDLIITLTNGVKQNVGALPKSGNGGKYARSPFEYAQESGYTGTEEEFNTALANIGQSGGGSWGSITGTLSEQTDLQEALDAKASTEDIPTALSELTEDETHRTVTDTEKTAWNGKQDALVSGTNIKTINGASVLGSGDITVAASKTRKQLFFENDFMYNNSSLFFPWYGGAINSGTMAVYSSDSNHPGAINFSSTSSANSGYFVLTAITAISLAGAEPTEHIFRTPPTISGTSTVKLGFVDKITYVDPTDGVWINLSGATLTGKTASSDTISTTSTSYTLSAATWYRTKIELNADATLATFSLYGDNGETPIWSDTLAANIPTGSGRQVGHGFIGTNSGTASASMIIMDYMNLKINRDLAR